MAAGIPATVSNHSNISQGIVGCMRNDKSLLFKSLIIGLMLSMWSVLAAGELETIKKAAERGNAEGTDTISVSCMPRVKGCQRIMLKPCCAGSKWAAEQGNAEAQFNLGVMYNQGDGVPEDHAEAVRWYQMAAEQGYAVAQCILGFMYDQGDGVPEDDAEAVRWYQMAAEQGYAGAQYQSRYYVCPG